MGQVFLAQVVSGNNVGPVIGLFVLEDTCTAVPLHFQGDIQRGKDILGGEYPVGVRAERTAVEQVAVVFQLRVRGFGIEHGEVGGRIGPTLVRRIEAHGFLPVALEEIIALNGRSRHAQPAGSHVLPHERIVVEVVVGGGVPFKGLQLIVIAVVPPGNEALEIHGIGQEGRFQDAGRVLQNTVLHLLDAVFPVTDRVLPMQDGGQLVMLVIVTFLFAPGKAGVPFFKGCPGGGGRIGQINGVDPGPQEAVSLGYEGIYHNPVGKGVLQRYVPLIAERVGDAQAVRHLHGIPGKDLGGGIHLFVFSEQEEVLFVRQGIRQGGMQAVARRKGIGHGQAVPEGKGIPQGKAVLLHQRIPLRAGEPGMQARSPGNLYPQCLRRHDAGNGQWHQYVRPELCHILQR